MGGNALKNVKIVRFSLEEYEEVKTEILTLLRMGGFECSVPHSRLGKESFGDLDVVVKIRDGVDLYKWIKEVFNPDEIVSNLVYSFSYPSIASRFDRDNYDNYQIDFIPVKSIDTAMFFYSYGDLGAIIGKYCSFIGLTFSDDGIGIKSRRELIGVDEKIQMTPKLICLTRDPIEICDILGLDYNKWQTLSTIDDIFDWLMESKYYTREAYEFIPMRKRGRINHRQMYQSFLEKIGVKEINNIENKIINPYDFEFHKNLLLQYGKWEEMEKIKSNVLLCEERRKKFNSEPFIEFGLKGKEIGISMSNFKKGQENFDLWLDTKTKEEVSSIVKFCLNYYGAREYTDLVPQSDGESKI